MFSHLNFWSLFRYAFSQNCFTYLYMIYNQWPRPDFIPDRTWHKRRLPEPRHSLRLLKQHPLRSRSRTHPSGDPLVSIQYPCYLYSAAVYSFLLCNYFISNKSKVVPSSWTMSVYLMHWNSYTQYYELQKVNPMLVYRYAFYFDSFSLYQNNVSNIKGHLLVHENKQHQYATEHLKPYLTKSYMYIMLCVVVM